MDLFEVLAKEGAPLVVETLAGLDAGTIKPKLQDHSRATLAPILDREDGRMDFACAHGDGNLESLAWVSAVAWGVSQSSKVRS